MMIPLDSPPPFDDDSTPDDDPFNASNRPSSIGRVSDFPPIDEIDRAETKKRGLNDSSIQMFRLLVRGVRVWCSNAKRENFNYVSHSSTHFVVRSSTHSRQNHSHTNTELALEHRCVRVSWIRIPRLCFFKTRSIRSFLEMRLGSSSLSSLERTRAIEQAVEQCLCSAASLVLKSRDVVNVVQDKPMGEITVSPGKLFSGLSSMVSVFEFCCLLFLFFVVIVYIYRQNIFCLHHCNVLNINQSASSFPSFVSSALSFFGLSSFFFSFFFSFFTPAWFLTFTSDSFPSSSTRTSVPLSKLLTRSLNE